jgi:hypothetical protein
MLMIDATKDIGRRPSRYFFVFFLVTGVALSVTVLVMVAFFAPVGVSASLPWRGGR